MSVTSEAIVIRAYGGPEVLKPEAVDVPQAGPGDRLACIAHNCGAYARARKISAALAVAVPVGIDDGVAATWYLKGLTA